ncbi:hypothetical protein BMH32_04655 [Leucobacter sp. OLJS4]|uniref:hypothetical protein n=1 Tax=unclassified Leucobacter TaxID=2621730 RepID=UPI000C3C9DE2|nr:MULTISPECIES: hypothetical protein [unclassified Leucobacter]PII81569.1 hypothetical protein BMH25_13665 [Leucobacter sp. OLCALW19]PII86241.1 hypothetical protein BMH26_14085 [Leucobacter sp. OLTLW20]PII90136.1 hypothetical protein BMH27_12250 [Leucobacter sp. OLAS13]PII97169.1 hypothetical protein BMH29_12935 [Leucobacter sp. OLDS2]PIJ00017.1 hypothetical protein BMH28_09750 [Leucobacter sp. OLCS4]
MVTPRTATQRNFSRPTYGGHQAAVAARIGAPFIPWQRYVADVAGEVDEHGMLYYNTVFLTLPRQAGKTQFDLGRNLQSCLMGPNRRAWYTAQSGQHASAKWREMSDVFTESKLKRFARRRLTNGSEVLKFRNGSEFRPHPPTEDSLHSKQSDSNSVDEAWAFSELQGTQLLAAIQPTTATRRMLVKQQPQLWIISAEGTIESTFWNPRIDAARAMENPRTAVFDFGIPDGSDPLDLENIARWHPGYGHLLDMETLVTAAGQLPPGEFARAYGNRRTGATERVISAEAWAGAADLGLAADGPLCFGAAVGVDGVDTTITVAQRVTPAVGQPYVLVAVVNGGHDNGTWWALDRLKELSAKYGAPVAIDRVGPSASLYLEAQAAGLTLVDLDSAKVSAACQRTLGGITNPNGPTLRFKQHHALDAAVELATRRWISDGAWVWGRRASVGSISALESGTLAAFGLDNAPKAVGFQLG